MEIYVVGKQWMWKVQHPDGQREINELHVPVGPPVKLTMASEDVIHSFFIPAFRVKMDVVPGPLHHDVVRGDQARHVSPVLRRVLRHEALGMIGSVVVMEPAEYQAWLSGGAAEGPLAGGREAVQATSAATPATPATAARGRGPVLEGPVRQAGQLPTAGRRSSPTRPTSASRS